MVYIVTALLLCLLWYKTKNKTHLKNQTSPKPIDNCNRFRGAGTPRVIPIITHRKEFHNVKYHYCHFVTIYLRCIR